MAKKTEIIMDGYFGILEKVKERIVEYSLGRQLNC